MKSIVTASKGRFIVSSFIHCTGNGIMTMSEKFNLSQDQDADVRSVIRKKVRQLIANYGYSACDAEDLTQNFLARVIKSLRRYDSTIGEFGPFVRLVIDRHFRNIVRDKCADKRRSGKLTSLNSLVNTEDTGSTELIQTIGEDQSDRRLGRERMLSQEELSDLRTDLATIIARLPESHQEFLMRRRTQTLSEISRETGTPRATLRAWASEIRTVFEQAGLEKYLER